MRRASLLAFLSILQTLPSSVFLEEISAVHGSDFSEVLQWLIASRSSEPDSDVIFSGFLLHFVLTHSY